MPSQSSMASRVILNPRLGLSAYGRQFYAFDIGLRDSPLVRIPTEKISNAIYKGIRSCKGAGLFVGDVSIDEIRAHLAPEFDANEVIEACLNKSYFLPHETSESLVKKRFLENLSQEFGLRSEPQAQDTAQPEPIFAPNRFFNLPEKIDNEDVNVGLIGVPAATLSVSAGTQLGPDMLRHLSRDFVWFTTQKNGAYFDHLMDGVQPEVLGKGIVLKDFGDINCAGRTPEELYTLVLDQLRRDIWPNQIRPLFIGGDHSVSYPIVRAFLQEIPEMGLIHLDAHNDLFYVSDVEFNHAAVLSNIFKTTDIAKIASFGLRSVMDHRVKHISEILAHEDAENRLSLTSIASLKQLLAQPERLDERMASLSGRPYYLSLDLDILSARALCGQTSTPSGKGLEWYELHQVLASIFSHLDIVGADLVEFNPAKGSGTLDASQINALLVRLIDGLAKK